VLLLGRIFQIILIVTLLVLEYGVWSLYFGFLVYFVFPLIIWVLVLKYIYNITIFNFLAFRMQKLKDLMKFGGALTTANVANMFVLPFNKIIIAKYVGLSEVAYYQIAIKVVLSIREVFAKELEAILPKISEIYGKTLELLKQECICSVYKNYLESV